MWDPTHQPQPKKRTRQEIIEVEKAKRQNTKKDPEVIDVDVDDDDSGTEKNALAVVAVGKASVEKFTMKDPKISADTDALSNTDVLSNTKSPQSLLLLPHMDLALLGPLAGPTVQKLIQSGEEVLDSELIAKETVNNITTFLSDGLQSAPILTPESTA